MLKQYFLLDPNLLKTPFYKLICRGKILKTIFVAAQAGGKGPLAIDWYVPTKNTANYLAFVYYEKKQVWIFNMKDLEKLYKKGQCQKASGKYHLSMYLEENKKSKKIKFRKFYDKYLLENKLKELEK